MSKKLRSASALVLAAALGLAVSAPAKADIWQITFSGTIKDGTDVTGVFGAANTDLTGLHYSSTFFFDTSVGDHLLFSGLSFTEYLRGGTLYAPFASPLVSSTFTIGATSVNVRSSEVGEIFTHLDGDVDVNGHTHSDTFATTAYSFSDFNLFSSEINGSEIQNLTGALPGDFSHPFVYHAIASDTQLGRFAYEQFDFHTHIEQTAFANLLPDTIVFGAQEPPPPPPPPGVPEPGAWALMLVGFGAMGSAMRRRTATAAA